MKSSFTDQSLQTQNPDLFSTVRRSTNALKEKEVSSRKSALQQLLKIITTEQLSGACFEQIAQLSLKDVLKCFSDHSEICRQLATTFVLQILPRSSKISPLLPYIFSVLVDRTNCHDLQGISNLPEKMRPPPGQKPKVLIKVVQNCEEIRILYCNLLRKIVSLLQNEGDEVRKYLDDLINLIRALIMDPASQVQKMACETLELTCNMYKDLLLHYTEIMGRAVLLSLISKKSKVRIAGLKALNAVFWCGLYKYNAFVFENLIGFRDPNSVPIKDFYEPSHNINYLATFITDEKNSVRQEFMKSIKMWVCDLNDKYDHHGKLVPYLLSGLFDPDEQVQRTALEAIDEIGRQIQTEREKDFRESKQFAIDAKWTWDGKLVHLPVDFPLTRRPSLGSRFFIRGHVRKFWSALYREIRDIKIQNRVRACNLIIYGAIYTQNYLTQYLDDMIPQLLASVIPHEKEDVPCCKKIEKMFYYIGRYCEQSTYLHIMKSALEGKLVQNEEFIKASLKALTRLFEGSLEAVPEGQGLWHKKTQIIGMLDVIRQSGIVEQIYNFNCRQVQDFVVELVSKLKAKGTQEEISLILDQHFVTILKLWSVGYHEQTYNCCFKLELYTTPNQQTQGNTGEGSDPNREKQPTSDRLLDFMHAFKQLASGQFFDLLQEYLSEVYQNPPSLMDSDFKLVAVLGNFLLKWQSQSSELLLSLSHQIIGESLSYNRSVEILNFCFKYVCWLWDEKSHRQKLTHEKADSTESQSKMYKQLSLVLERCINNLNKFKPQKKVPVYDQHLVQNNQRQEGSDVMKINQDTFLILFKNASEALNKFYTHKTPLTNSTLGRILGSYIDLSKKMRINQDGIMTSIKTLWAVFEREEVNEEFPRRVIFKDETKEQIKPLPKVIDYVVERIQTLGQPEHKKVVMLFSILQNVLKCFPVFVNAATALPLIYPEYNELFEKLIKYSIDEKDIELKQKLVEFLKKAAKKMRPWFELQLKMSVESQKFIKAQFLKDVLNI